MKYFEKDTKCYLHNQMTILSIVNEQRVKNILDKYKTDDYYELRYLNNLKSDFQRLKLCNTNDYDCKYQIYSLLSKKYNNLLNSNNFYNFIKKEIN
jgi:hypothetical protein